MNFGEILEPSSRAFWDDFEDELEENYDYTNFLSKTNWIWLNEEIPPKFKKISSFIAIEGSGMSDFMKSAVIKNLKPIGKLDNDNVLMYHIPESNQIICFSKENDLNLSGSIVENFLKSFVLEANQVVTLSLQSNVQYKAEDFDCVRHEITFLRGINSNFNYVKELKAPNFITGICAGVASLRYIETLSISSYIAYTDPLNELDDISVQPILHLLKDLDIKCDNKYFAKYKDQSHLYI